MNGQTPHGQDYFSGCQRKLISMEQSPGDVAVDGNPLQPPSLQCTTGRSSNEYGA